MIGISHPDTICLNKQQYAVFCCLCYFQIFQHPLKASEILEFSNKTMHAGEVETALREMLDLGIVHSEDGYYSPEKEITALILKRTKSEERFARKLKTISRYASFISKFPYVQFVGISGSCSKGLFEKDSDVDYFIITKPGKLWLCRTILILFKKVFLLNSKKYFCLNYFVDSENLLIPDQNIFVAHELKTLVPVNNEPLFKKLIEVNSWTDKFLPNRQRYNDSLLKHGQGRTLFARAMEIILSGRLGDALDRWCQSLTYNTWKKRFTGLKEQEFELNFRSKRNVSKHHPRGFQKRVLEGMEQRLDNIKVMA